MISNNELEILAYKQEIKALKEKLAVAEQTLLDRELIFDTILESTFAGYWDWYIQDNYEYLSPNFKAMFGFEDHEVDHIPNWWQKQMYPEDLPKVHKAYNKHLASKGAFPYDNEVRYYHKDGSIVWVYCKGKIIQWDKEGNPLRMIGCHINITPLKKALEEIRGNKDYLEESRQLYKYLYENAHEMHVSVELETGNIIKCNNTLCKKLGYKKEELIGKHIYSVYHSSCVDKVKDLFDKFLKKGRIRNEELILCTKGGEKIDVVLNTTAVKDENGEILYSRSSWYDISEKKEVERQEKLNAELKNKNKELEQFVYISSHDLQEPLNTITGFVQLFQRDYPSQFDKKATNYLKFIVQSTERMQHLIKDLLDYSCLGRNRVLHLIDFNEVIAVIKEDMATIIENTGTIFEISELPKLKVFETEIRLLFQNLISNAIKFRKKGVRPEIRISAQQENGYWRFFVADNGIGIDSQYNEKIFSIFQRLHLRTEYEGTGIGLAHCRKIVELHNGIIGVNSQPGKGSTFFFTIANLE